MRSNALPWQRGFHSNVTDSWRGILDEWAIAGRWWIVPICVNFSGVWGPHNQPRAHCRTPNACCTCRALKPIVPYHYLVFGGEWLNTCSIFDNILLLSRRGIIVTSFYSITDIAVFIQSYPRVRLGFWLMASVNRECIKRHVSCTGPGLLSSNSQI